MEIQELRNYTLIQFDDIKQLMSELSDRVNFTQIDLMQVLKDTNSHLYAIIDDEHIVGCATLCIFHSPTGKKAFIEDVVVSSNYRGQHLGKWLMEHVLEQAKSFAPIELHLTSNPKRVAANKLYQSLGFQKKETNCYQMFLFGGSSDPANHDVLKQSITCLFCKERAEGNREELNAEYISKVLGANVDEVREVLRNIQF